jgi:L-asparaginase
MKQDPETLALTPFNFSQILEEVPELKKFRCNIETYSFDPPIDSSDIQVDFWVTLAQFIEKNYEKYDGFVILHGTDTMSFSASALSFMLEDLEKPVIFTGSQLPIGMLRTDGKENLISSIEIAAARDEHGMASPSSASFAATASARSFTKTRRCCTTARRAPARNWSRA